MLTWKKGTGVGNGARGGRWSRLITWGECGPKRIIELELVGNWKEILRNRYRGQLRILGSSGY